MNFLVKLIKMKSISEGYVNRNETALVKCPKCEGVEVIIKTDGEYFSVTKCNTCGYQKNNKKSE